MEKTCQNFQEIENRLFIKYHSEICENEEPEENKQPI